METFWGSLLPRNRRQRKSSFVFWEKNKAPQGASVIQEINRVLICLRVISSSRNQKSSFVFCTENKTPRESDLLNDTDAAAWCSHAREEHGSRKDTLSQSRLTALVSHYKSAGSAMCNVKS